jgi:hypothetical protein
MHNKQLSVIRFCVDLKMYILQREKHVIYVIVYYQACFTNGRPPKHRVERCAVHTLAALPTIFTDFFRNFFCLSAHVNASTLKQTVTEIVTENALQSYVNT